MQKKTKVGIFIIGIILIVIFVVIGIFNLVQYIRMKNAKIEVTLVEDLTLDFADTKQVSDYIVSINGNITNDYVIDSTKLGSQEVNVDFINDDGFKVSYKYNIEVVDRIEPVIWLGSSYTINKGSNIDITSKILCGDNEDEKPNCYIEGDYDYNKVGVYPLTFIAKDKSGNIARQEFNLNVIEPSKNNTPSKPTTTYFSDIVSTHKTDKTRIGLDISSWQGDIDFDALQNAGVEFVIIRVGGTRGRDGKYFVDDKFTYNITEANKRNIDVGVYFYSYASTSDKAREEAIWVLDMLKDKKIDLQVAFDWENWSTFNEYNLSFFGLTNMAETFLDTINEAGYEGLLYSSKNYLERLWLPSKYETWLAHYTNKTSYTGKYRYWQICSDGKVDGIKGYVDIDIMYLD